MRTDIKSDIKLLRVIIIAPYKIALNYPESSIDSKRTFLPKKGNGLVPGSMPLPAI